MQIYRILKEPYWHDPLSVVGAEMAGGRWNPPGLGVLYAATSPALALLETLVHFPKVSYHQLPKLHPRHPLYQAITIVNSTDVLLDQRLWNSPNP